MFNFKVRVEIIKNQPKMTTLRFLSNMKKKRKLPKLSYWNLILINPNLMESASSDCIEKLEGQQKS